MQKFKISNIGKNIYLVKETGFLEFANIFVFANKKQCLIFDAGVGMGDLKEFLKKQGFEAYMATTTHSHFDHVGGLSTFLNSEIFLTKKIAQCLKHPKSYALQYLKKSEFDASEQFIKAKSNFPLNIKPEIIGKEFTFGEFIFKTIASPGHSTDSIMFYEKNNKILISGDSFYDGKPYFDLPDSSKEQTAETLSLIKKLNPLIILPGHNKIIKQDEIGEINKRWKDCLANNRAIT